MEKQIHTYLTSLGSTSTLMNALAFQVYIELTEVKVMYDVSFTYNNVFSIVYLMGKPTKKSKPSIFIPYSTSAPITLKFIEELQKTLCKDTKNKAITLACVEGDSTVVFYTFSAGLIDLQDPQYLVRQKTREERRDLFENEIKKRKYEFLVEAHRGGIIED